MICLHQFFINAHSSSDNISICVTTGDTNLFIPAFDTIIDNVRQISSLIKKAICEP